MERRDEGSLTSVLKNYGWINSLTFDYNNVAREMSFFNIAVQLTEEGVLHTDEIITMIFQYIEMIKKDEPFEWIFDVSTFLIC